MEASFVALCWSWLRDSVYGSLGNFVRTKIVTCANRVWMLFFGLSLAPL